MKKKIIAFILSMILILQSVPIIGYASSLPSYQLSNKSVQNNEMFSVDVVINDNPGIISLRFKVLYDSASLELLEVEDSCLINGYTSPSPTISSPYTLRWADSLATDNNYSNGTVVTLKFRALKVTNTTISIEHNEARNFKGEKISFTNAVSNISISEIDLPCNHSYSEWTYNGDAKYNSSSSYTNGTQSRTCTVCGETETVEAPNTALLRRRGNALALESSITLTTYITKDIVDYYDEVYAEFTRNDKTQTVYASDKTFTSGSTVYNVFDYKGISPQAMGDNIEITFYGIKDGVKYWGETYTYSVTTYVQSTLSKSTASSKLKTMLVDLMYYGAACQTYSNYKTDALMTDILTDEQKQLKSNYTLELSNIKNSSYKTCENRLVRFGTALRMNNAVEIALPINMTNVTLDDLTLKVKIGTRELTYTYAENPENFEKGSDGYWYFYFDGVYANQMSDEVFISAYRGSEQVSYTLKYSVESYAATVTDSKLKAVTDAMMYYGNSAKAYAGN